MRVVAGTLSGRRIEAPHGHDTRPTTDRVREAIFNALGSLDLIRDAVVADLYAGTGALGIEALSRGAAHVTFVEKHRAALGALRSNLENLSLNDTADVIAADASGVAGRLDVDLALADPPYDFDAWPELLASVRAPFVVAEAASEITAPAGWRSVRAKRYGRTWVTFLARDE